jgi:hypothetical protein
VAELADAHDSKSCSVRSIGSTPITGIKGRNEKIAYFKRFFLFVDLLYSNVEFRFKEMLKTTNYSSHFLVVVLIMVTISL